MTVSPSLDRLFYFGYVVACCTAKPDAKLIFGHCPVQIDSQKECKDPLEDQLQDSSPLRESDFPTA